LATITELMAAIEAHNEMIPGNDKVDAPDDDEMAALLAKYGS